MIASEQLTPLVKPLEEGGFVALSAILLIVLVGGGGWVIKKLLDVISHNSEVLTGVTVLLKQVNEKSEKTGATQDEILRRITAVDTRCEERCNKESR